MLKKFSILGRLGWLGVSSGVLRRFSAVVVGIGVLVVDGPGKSRVWWLV